ncbi:MAG: I78 family peptidase inhibitor [Sulfitobacter dubius]
MRLVFLAPLLVAGCAEVATAPVQNPIPAPTAPTATAPPPARPAPAETSTPSTKPKPLPSSVINAVNETSSTSTSPQSPPTSKPLSETCKEGSWWGLVGRPRSAASIVSEPKRVYTEGDPVTMDANPNRTNIVLDAEGKIAKVTCG